MDYGTKYLTFAEYTALGGSITDENAFNLLEYEARKEIDINTLNRIVNANPIPNEVKICMFTLINKIQTISEQKYNVSSETVGSYSVSYGSVQEIIKSNKSQLDNIIMNDLFGLIVNGEHAIYRGVK